MRSHSRRPSSRPKGCLPVSNFSLTHYSPHATCEHTSNNLACTAVLMFQFCHLVVQIYEIVKFCGFRRIYFYWHFWFGVKW